MGTVTLMATTCHVIDPADLGILKSLSKRAIRDGEKRLMLALLENVMADYQKHVLATSRKGKTLFEAAEAWVLETDSRSFFSFNNVCEHLELNPEYLRKGIMRWKQARLCRAKRRPNNLKSNAV